MKWTVKISSFIIRSLVALGFIALAAAGALLISYFFGAAILEGGSVIGSDSSYHLSWIHTLDRFWPRVPLWFPYAGSGSSIVFGYWIAPYYAVLKLAHSSIFNIEQVFRVLQFLTVPIVAFELYLFGWLRLKNHIIGLIAALLYPLSSIAWGWIAHAGFFSMHISLVMVIPALIFYDAYLEDALKGPSLRGRSFETLKRRLNLLGTGIFIAASLITHLAAGASLLLGLPLYTLVRSLTYHRHSELVSESGRSGNEKILKQVQDDIRVRAKFKKCGALMVKRFLQGVGACILAVVVGIGISAFLILPQKRYFDFQAQDFTPIYAPHDFPQFPWKGFLGLERLAESDLRSIGSLHTPLFLPKIVTLMGFLGIGLGLLLRSPAGALGILALFYVVWVSQTQFIAGRLPLLNTFLLPTGIRAAGIPGALFPLLAGYGVFSLIDLPGRMIRFFAATLANVAAFRWVSQVVAPVTLLIAAVPAVLLTGHLVYNYRSLQEYPPVGRATEGYQGYGSLGFNPPLCIIPGWEKVGIPQGRICEDLVSPALEDLLSSESIDSINLPRLIKKVEISPSGRDPLYEMEFDEKMKPFALDEGTRMTISPYLGSLIFAINGHTRASMTNSPSGQSVLNLSWRGIQDRSFFQPGDATPQEVTELAKWFGIHYVFLHLGDDEDVLYRYAPEEWPEVEVLGGVMQMREFKNSPGMAVISKKPAVLVIGAQEKRAYESVFRGAVKGALSYDQAILLQGTDQVDDYSLEELQKFQVLILQGYTYKNRNKAWNLLRQYVEEGGGLFVDTGWQYVAKDWSTKKTGDRSDPVYIAELEEPFPIKKTTWGDAGKSWTGFSLDKEIAGGLELSDFGSLVWEDQPWSLAYADRNDLASWAEPVLYSDEGKVLVAGGDFGGGPASAGGLRRGKVIWSGMNLFSHAYDKKSAAEYRFIGQLLAYLLGEVGAEQKPAKIDRPFPDQVELTIEPVEEEDIALRSPERQSRGEEEPALRSSKSEGGWLYWAETYTPDWKAYLVTNGKKQPLTTHRAGPGFQAFKLPPISQNTQIVLEYDLRKVLLISFSITILTLLIVIITILDPLLFKRGLETRIRRGLNEHFSFLKAIGKNRLLRTLAREDEEY